MGHEPSRIMRITRHAILPAGLLVVLGLLLALRFQSDPGRNPGAVAGGAEPMTGAAPPGGRDPATRPMPRILQEIAEGKPVSAWQPGYEALCRHDFNRWSAYVAPEMLVLRDIVRRWGVAEGKLYSTVRQAYQAIMARKMYSLRLESLSREIAELGKAKSRRDPTPEDSHALKSADEDTRERNQFLMGIYSQDLKESMRDYEASIRDHTGITDPEFYRQLFALTPQNDSLGIDTEGWIKAGAPGAYD